MSAYGSLAPWVRACFMAWGALTLFLLCYNFVRYVQQRRSLTRILFETGLFLADYLLLQLLMAEKQGDRPGVWMAGLPWLLPALFLAVLTLLAAQQLQSILDWKKTHITPGSVKECADGLPSGLCFSLPGGLPRLVNLAMEDQCRRLTGESLLDADAFWETLRTGALPPAFVRVRGGDQPIIRLPEGRVLSFRRTALTLHGRRVWELTSADVSREYLLSERLTEQREKERAINLRLRALNGEIRQMTIARETLALKIRVHDRMGQALLQAKRYLTEPMPDPDRLAELLDLWREHVRLLKEQRSDQDADPLGEVLAAAGRLGVEVTLTGELPRSREGTDLTAAAVFACMTNTLRHAGGKTMTLDGRRTETGWRLEITNSGRPPAGPIVEGGGLGNLRRKTEALGGTMTVAASPRFLLTLTLPREDRPPENGTEP